LKWGARNSKYRIPENTFNKNGAEKSNEVSGQAKNFNTGYRLPDDFYAVYDNQIQYNSPNVSNPEVWEMYAEYYINWFKEHPEKDYVSISAEDGLVRDTRKESQKLSSFEYDWIQGEFSATDKLWFFHNRVIEKIVMVFPECTTTICFRQKLSR